jgi:NDP-sugar pyrophosphorylase family protein
MTTGAVLIIGPPEIPASGFRSPLHLDSTESLAGYPLACLEVLGRSVVDRTLAWLHEAGASPITLIGPDTLAGRLGKSEPEIETCFGGSTNEIWQLAQQKVKEHFQGGGVETLVLMRLGPYIELSLYDLLRFHEDHGSSVCQAWDEEGPLDVWVIGEAAARATDFSYVGFPHWDAAPVHRYYGCHYVNRLRNPRELRQLVVDCLHSRCTVRPDGTEVKPGMWVDDQAYIHREARVVAPAYIGRHAKVQASALITRSSSLEHDCEVGEATVVEEATVLPDTYLGRWLDVSHAVVDGSTFVDLSNDVAVEIADSALVGRARSSEAGNSVDDGEHLKFVKRLGGRVKRAFLH